MKQDQDVGKDGRSVLKSAIPISLGMVLRLLRKASGYKQEDVVLVAECKNSRYLDDGSDFINPNYDDATDPKVGIRMSSPLSMYHFEGRSLGDWGSHI